MAGPAGQMRSCAGAKPVGGSEITVKSPSSSRAGLCWALLARLGPVLALGGGCTSASPALHTPPSSSVIHQCSERCLITASAFLLLIFVILILPQHLVC